MAILSERGTPILKPAVHVINPISDPKCRCGAPGKYIQGKGRDRVGFCELHAPANIRNFQALALALIRRGGEKRRAKKART